MLMLLFFVENQRSDAKSASCFFENKFVALSGYWKVKRLKKDESELAANCSQLKIQSADGKFHKTDVVSTEQLKLIYYQCN
jgi:hypothetical protein